jgi:hypothetical protein
MAKSPAWQRDDLIYFAGFFDGEGCISITRQKKTWGAKDQTYFHRLRINVAQKDPTVLKQLYDVVGGTIHCNRGVWKWYADDAAAVQFLETLTPFLRIKKAQAELALEFSKTKKGGKDSITAEVFELRERLCVAVRKEKERQYA